MTDLAMMQPETLNIRFATYDDIPQITHVARVTWDATYSHTIDIENRKNFLREAYQTQSLQVAIEADSGHWFYVAERDSLVVGFGHFMRRYHPTQGRAELIRFYVLPDYQNQGIGKTILTQGFAALAEADIRRCSVSVQASNQRARSLYERFGFEYHRMHGQFLGTQIIILAQYVRLITPKDLTINRYE